MADQDSGLPFEDQARMVMSDEDERAVKQVKKRYDIAKRDKKRFSDKWSLYWKLTLGRHWPEGRTQDFDRARPVIQKTHQAVETRLAHLTSRRPIVSLYVSGDQGVAPAETFQRLFDAKWDSSGIDFQNAQSIRNTLVVGVGCLFVGHRPAEVLGGEQMYDCDVDLVDPHHIFLSPGALDEGEADWIDRVKNITMGQLRREYHDQPEIMSKIDMVKPGVDDPDLFVDVLAEAPGNSGEAARLKVDDNAGNASGPYYGRSDGGRGDDDDDLVTVYEEWSRREDGSIRLRVIAGNVLLIDQDSPYNDKEYPFVFFRLSPSSITFWSPGIVQAMSGLQLILNKLMAQVLDIMAKCGAPILLVPSESGIDVKSIKMKPGLVLPYNAGDGTAPNWLQPNAIPNGIFEILQYLGDQIDRVAGNQEILSGGAPAGVEAARAIEALASQAGVRIEREANFLKKAYHRLAMLIVSRIKQFYSGVYRRVPIVGQDGAMAQVEVNKASFEDGSNAITNPVLGDEEILIDVEVGASLPAVRLAEYQKEVQMGESGVYGPKLLPNGMVNPVWQREQLKAAQKTGYKQIMEEVNQIMAAAQQQAIQMQLQLAQAQAQIQGQAEAQAGGQPQTPPQPEPKI